MEEQHIAFDDKKKQNALHFTMGWWWWWWVRRRIKVMRSRVRLYRDQPADDKVIFKALSVLLSLELRLCKNQLFALKITPIFYIGKEANFYGKL